MRRHAQTVVGAATVALVGLVIHGTGSLPGAVSTGALRNASGGQPPSYTARPLTPTERIAATKGASRQAAQSDPALLDRSDTTPVPVLVKLDYDSVATYRGGVEGYQATSPQVTRRKMNATADAERRYAEYAAAQEERFAAALRERIPEAKIGRRFRTVYGGVSVVVPGNRLRDLSQIEQVVAVQPDREHRALTDSSPGFIGATNAHAKLGGAANAGEGLIFADLDTGLWPEHPSVADQGNLQPPPPRADGQPRPCEYGDNRLTPAVDVFQCNNKLIGGKAFIDTYHQFHDDDPMPNSPRDFDGHGTHTTTTAAGNVLESASVLGVERGPISGVAPGAWVIEYRVCGPQGCFTSDTVAAIEQAIVDGVDVINYSISGGTTPFADPAELAFLDAYAAGIFVAASAGNDGPDPGTTNHLAPWVTTVGASTQARQFESTLSLTDPGGETASFTGASLTDGIDTPAPVVMSAKAVGYENALCDLPAPPGVFDGVIVACERGVIPRVEKGANVLHGGALGMILYNPELADVETDNHWLPTVHLADGRDLVAYLESHPAATATFTAGEKTEGEGDVMAAFSSRGPGGAFLKPDVTAPGVQILAGHTDFRHEVAAGPPGERFQAIAGTSMSSPEVAGAALLLSALHPDWSPGQIKSALMTTATTELLKEDLATPADPFDFGAGRIDVARAAEVSLTFDETAPRLLGLAAHPVAGLHLNVPAIHTAVMPGKLTTHRVATNSTDRRVSFDVETDAPKGSRITVEPSGFTLDPGQSQQLTITIESGAPAAQYFGDVRLVERDEGSVQHLPVSFSTSKGGVHLAQACSPLEVELDDVTACRVTGTNGSFEPSVVDLQTEVADGLRIAGVDRAIRIDDRRVELTDVALNGEVPGVPAVQTAPGPSRYVPLDQLGIAPEPIGDEEILNVDVPAFTYADGTYNRIGIDSNGYLVAGGGTAEDNNCCNLSFFPDPTRPNNVLAPFWTDLDGSKDEGIFLAEVTDTVSGRRWVVVEWRVDVFGTDSRRVFQTWLGLGDEEDIAFAYNPAQLPAPPNLQPFLVGAENVNGTGGAQLPGEQPPRFDLSIVSAPGSQGDVASYVFFVEGMQPGMPAVTTTMEADNIPGTQVVSTGLVIRLGDRTLPDG